MSTEQNYASGGDSTTQPQEELANRVSARQIHPRTSADLNLDFVSDGSIPSQAMILHQALEFFKEKKIKYLATIARNGKDFETMLNVIDEIASANDTQLQIVDLLNEISQDNYWLLRQSQHSSLLSRQLAQNEERLTRFIETGQL